MLHARPLLPITSLYARAHFNNLLPLNPAFDIVFSLTPKLPLESHLKTGAMYLVEESCGKTLLAVTNENTWINPCVGLCRSDC